MRLQSLAIRSFLPAATLYRGLVWCLGCLVVGGTPLSLAGEGLEIDLSHSQRAFLQQHCQACHQGSEAEGGWDLDSLSGDLSQPKVVERWVRIFDRVQSGEMPPADSHELSPAERQRFLDHTSQALIDYQQAIDEKLGRVRGRRLTNLQLERSLQDLLGIDIPLAGEMPVESKTGEFNTFSDGQSMSHFQLEQHLKIVDLALDEAFRRALSEDDGQVQEFTAKQISRKVTRCREPEFIDGRAVVWSGQLAFYGRMPATEVRESGWYRVSFQVRSLKEPDDHGVWGSVRTGECVASAPLLGWVGAFEATREPKVISLDAWIPAGHMLEIRPLDKTMKQAAFAGGQVSNGEGGKQDVPGIALDWLKMERIHRGPDQQGVRRLVLGDWEVVRSEGKSPAVKPVYRVHSERPRLDLQRQLLSFARRAFRRDVVPAEIQRYVAFAQEQYGQTKDLAAALRVGYRSLLCSPRFLYFQEQPGQLDDFAIATRLSYMLLNSTPDEELLALASQGRLRQPAVLDAQVERILQGPRGQRFITDFAAQWLELNQIDFTEPDSKLYRDFDIVVQNAMLRETQHFLQHLLDENLSVVRFVDADFSFVDSRLARYYGLNKAGSSDLHRVVWQPEDRRRGLLTHGAILKVTANGTNTSPVLRGLWVAKRILGEDIPPPPESVPAIEPDIRGATTIREQLEKHRSDVACAACHSKIDPSGFALENFDAAGRWRESYLKLDKGKLRPGVAIDAGYVMKDGREFRNLEEFCQLVAEKPEPLARNFAAKLMAYATGAPIAFADRAAIEAIVEQTRGEEFGMRSLVKRVVNSPLFQIK
jgi:hypothetical protein